MELKDKLSVMVVTHLVNAHTNDPYFNNDMLVTTIKSSYERLKLIDVTYYIYIDSVCQPNLSTNKIDKNLYFKYRQAVLDKIQQEIPYINVIVVEDTQRFKYNYRHMIDNCNTEYFLFLEHDWEFIKDIPIEDILKEMDSDNNISYILFNRLNSPQWSKEEGGCFEQDHTRNIPLIKISLFSGNPHIIRTYDVKHKFMKWHADRWSDDININPYLEKDLLQIATDHIKSLGKYEQQKLWGCYLYGDVNNITPVISHLGDWCRKK